MDELHGFLFDGLPVRGQLVRLEAGWRELLARRSGAPYAPPVRELLGELSAAAVLLQGSLGFDGVLELQLQGAGPVRLAVAEVQADLRFRATATVTGTVPEAAGLPALIDARGQGRCTITLDPPPGAPGRQRYQGVVALRDEHDRPLPRVAQLLQQYMRRSEQLDARLVLAADERVAAGLLVQRLPAAGGSRPSGERAEDAPGGDEDFNRIAQLTATLRRDELLTLDAETVLRRLYWQERVRRFEPRVPRFACRCTRERVAGMLRSLGRAEIDSIVAEQGAVAVSCEFCGAAYRFDAVEAAQLCIPAADRPAAQRSIN